MEIPCKECLVYPMCRNKAYVDCDMLYNYVKRYEEQMVQKIREYFDTNNRGFGAPVIIDPPYNDYDCGRVIFNW